ncbi:RmlD substrate binding domain-containing protein [Micromonospora inyonensis]|uniref:dTDP-4-dehydrorhamnose reductase n=1 Tax=Micromonospora inyonensis TaxID=47866 RepID=A0A1C6SK08_9ACTN|nr:RmlD substrate binding domain-containing protein [Micromonospora inyonensis]
MWWADLGMLRRWHGRLLDDTERRRLAAIGHPRHRRQSTLGAVLLRLAVAHHRGVPADRVRVVRECPACAGPHGRPRLPEHRLSASVSHSGRRVVVAVAGRGEIGVDVERLGADHPSTELAQWCRRESVVKATGDGLRVRIRDVRITPPSDPPRLLGYPGRPGLRARLWDLRPGPGYRAAATLVTPASLPSRVRIVERAASHLLTGGPSTGATPGAGGGGGPARGAATPGCGGVGEGSPRPGRPGRAGPVAGGRWPVTTPYGRPDAGRTGGGPVTLLVVGASGHLGGELCRRAAATGERVVGTYHAREPALPGVQPRRLDVRDREAVRALVSEVRPDAVVGTSYRYDDWAVTADGAAHVAVAAAAVGARLVHVSSDSVHGGRYEPYGDDEPPSPIFAYGAAKAAAETTFGRSTPPPR